MFEWLVSLIRRHKGIFLYLFFGVLTTLVNYAVYFPLFNYADLSATLSNLIAWAASVVFAFVTNKWFVFMSRDRSFKAVLYELLKFLACRVASGFVETVILFVTVDLLTWNGNLWKIITGVIVIILNYLGSKYFAFKDK